jgi:hypothetical protein
VDVLGARVGGGFGKNLLAERLALGTLAAFARLAARAKENLEVLLALGRVGAFSIRAKNRRGTQTDLFSRRLEQRGEYDVFRVLDVDAEVGGCVGCVRVGGSWGERLIERERCSESEGIVFLQPHADRSRLASDDCPGIRLSAPSAKGDGREAFAFGVGHGFVFCFARSRLRRAKGKVAKAAARVETPAR